MQENKNLVKEALIQMKNVEEAIAENAKGILASTMKEEINQLVKESLSEQDEEDEIEADVEVDANAEMDTDNEDEMDMDMDIEASDEDDDMEMDFEMDSEESPIDLTDASDEEILKVFKAMSEEDGIIVKKDGEDIHLTDNDADTEYLVKMGESKKSKKVIKEEDEEGEESLDDIVRKIFAKSDMSSDEDMEMTTDMEDMEVDDMEGEEEGEEESEEMFFEIEMEEDEKEEEEESYDNLEEDDKEEEGESYHNLEEEDEEEEEEEGQMYEIHMEEDDDDDDDDSNLDEAYNHKKAIKPKGVGIGKGPKFTYEKSSKGGFKEDKKEGPKMMGTGKAKFDYKKGANMDGKSKVVKKAETKEAARTYGMGSKKGRGLRKGITPNRNLVYGKGGVKTESVDTEVRMLREKNEEYRKALNVFREKLNEVAIFNSNLAYATRLFTEHSTTKKEKINILRRFDNVETLKESKNLYKSIKDELSKSETKSINESVEKKINNTVSSGSATTLIESKTYENPQFLRMRDLMTKIR